ncbi:lipopolysaccharide biosynthesis protein [Winogradskyella sp. A2]|uniref:lipopolysaccharide biosynthesis protein n=1 Tax=Winogradskyella sp. A2 TaxID=3366944 RepID=UPI00398C40BB
MSRVSMTLRNAWVAALFFLVYIIVQFYSRNIFLDKLGDEFIGIVGTLKSILQFLNLSELGIGVAVGFSLYKPIYDDNKEKIIEIIGYLGFLYKRIGLFVLIASLLLLTFFPHIFDDVETNIGVIIFLFASLVVSNLLSYFFAYHAFLLDADQKSYVNITINQSIFILRLILQCLVLIYFENLIYWILLELLTPFLYIYILRKRIRVMYPWLVFKFKISKEIRLKHKNLLKKIKQISFHKLGTFITNGTDNIIIFSFINPTMVAFVGNYQLIMNNVNTLVNQFFNGTNASVGNLVAENDQQNIHKVFWEMMALRFFFAGCGTVLLFIGFDDLITIWIGTKYIMDGNILIALILIFFILQVRQPVDSYIQAYGLYSDIWAPVVQSSINLVFSIVFVKMYGVIGVFIGTIISQVSIVMLWRPYFLFSSGFRSSILKYISGFFSHLLYLLISYLIFYCIFDWFNNKPSSNLFLLILSLFKNGVVFSGIYFTVLIVLSNGFKDLFKRVKNLIKEKISKKGKTN